MLRLSFQELERSGRGTPSPEVIDDGVAKRTKEPGVDVAAQGTPARERSGQGLLDDVFSQRRVMKVPSHERHILRSLTREVGRDLVSAMRRTRFRGAHGASLRR